MRKPWHSVAIESMERRLHLDASQLTVSIAASSLAASVSDESVAKGTVTVDVVNNTAAIQKFKSKIEVLGGTVVLASKGASIALVAGAGKDFSIPVSIAKNKLADGAYTLFAEATEAGGIFSESAAGGSLLVRPPIVALSETEIFRKLPTTVAPNVKFNTTDVVSITNSGSDPSADPLTIGVYAFDGDTSANATLLTTVKKKITIKAGRTASVGIGIKVPAGLPAGTYRIITEVTQSDSTVTLTNFATAPVVNVPAPATNPEFVDSILMVTPLYVNQSSGGQTVSEIDLGMFIENKGVTADTSSQYALYVSSSPTFDSTATLITSLPLTQTIPGADGGKSFQVDFGIAQPNPSVFNGSSLYVFVQVTDPDGDVTVGSYATPVAIN